MIAALAPLHRRRLADMRTAIDADSFDQAEQNLVALAARWTTDAQAKLISDAFALAAYEGREAVFLDGEDAPADTAFAGGITFQQQIDFLTQKRPKPTNGWLDVLRGGHDRSLVVAGVKDTAMLEEFQVALISAAKGGVGIKGFANEFDRLVEKYGWDYKGERNWRIKTIYQTNMRTSFMAGRLKQMRDPDVVRLRPYWQYVHADERIPVTPRKQHVEWDGLWLRWDDPWWDIHFPPNDWMCSCGVRSRSEGELRRSGRSGPDTAPKDALLPIVDKATGQMIMQPVGIGYGWDYLPGDHWERGLVPSALIDEAGGIDLAIKQLVSIDKPEPIADLVARAVGTKARLLAPGLTPEEYARAFLKPFGADIDKAVMFTDAAGMRIPISADLLRSFDGTFKADKRGRGIYAELLAEAIRDPDEIWLGLAQKPNPANPEIPDIVLDRRYVRVDPKSGLFAVFELSRTWWQGITTYATTDAKGRTSYSVLDARRGGKLIWRRK